MDQNDGSKKVDTTLLMRRASTSIINCTKCSVFDLDSENGSKGDLHSKTASTTTPPPVRRPSRVNQMCHVHSHPILHDTSANVRRMRSIEGFKKEKVNYITSGSIAQNVSVRIRELNRISSHKLPESNGQHAQLPQPKRMSMMRQGSSLLHNKRCVSDGSGNSALIVPKVGQRGHPLGCSDSVKTADKRLSKALNQQLDVDEDDRGPLYYTLKALLDIMGPTEYCEYMAELKSVTMREGSDLHKDAQRQVNPHAQTNLWRRINSRMRTQARTHRDKSCDATHRNNTSEGCDAEGSEKDRERCSLGKGLEVVGESGSDSNNNRPVSESVYQSQLLHTPSTKVLPLSLLSKERGSPRTCGHSSSVENIDNGDSLPNSPDFGPNSTYADVPVPERRGTGVSKTHRVTGKSTNTSTYTTTEIGQCTQRQPQAQTRDEFCFEEDTIEAHTETTTPIRTRKDAGQRQAMEDCIRKPHAHELVTDEHTHTQAHMQRSKYVNTDTHRTGNGTKNTDSAGTEATESTQCHTKDTQCTPDSKSTLRHKTRRTLNERITKPCQTQGAFAKRASPSSENEEPSDKHGTRGYLALIVNKAARDQTAILVVRPNKNEAELRAGKWVRLSVVMPVWTDTTLSLHGDGSLRLVSVIGEYVFGMPSVRSLWSTHSALVKAVRNAERHNYYPGGPSHEWIEWYVRYGKSLHGAQSMNRIESARTEEEIDLSVEENDAVTYVSKRDGCVNLKMDGLTSASPTPERNFSCDMMINNTLPSQNDNNQQRQELQRQNQQNQHQYQYSTSVILSDTNTQIDCGQSSDTLDGSIHAQTTNAKIFMAISTPPRVRTSVENAVDSFEGRIGKDSASVTEAEPYSPVSQGVAELGAQCQDGMGTTMDDGKSHEHDGLPQIARQLTLDSVATAEPEHASVGAVNHNINMLDTSAINDSTARLNCDQSYETSEDVRMEEASTPPQSPKRSLYTIDNAADAPIPPGSHASISSTDTVAMPTVSALEYAEDRGVSDSGQDQPTTASSLQPIPSVSKDRIDVSLREIMLRADLDNLTCGEVRRQLEVMFQQDLRSYKKYIDERMMVVLGQMEESSEIFDRFLYLGTEWNASNRDELLNNKVGFVLNMAIEIEDFFPDQFRYCHIRVWDEPEADIYPYLDEAADFICEAKRSDSGVLVHCQMGVSRSATAVIAYCIRDLKWTLDDALVYVKGRRNVVNPNSGFREQLVRFERKCIKRRKMVFR